jgi:mannosyl-oligosaccharide alpha-1,2-mannosidase
MRLSLPRRSFLGLAALTGLGVAGARSALGTAPSALAQPSGSWQALANDVRRETRWAWRSYVDRAFGHDQIKPVSGGYEEFFAPVTRSGSRSWRPSTRCG